MRVIIFLCPALISLSRLQITYLGENSYDEEYINPHQHILKQGTGLQKEICIMFLNSAAINNYQPNPMQEGTAPNARGCSFQC